MLLESFYILQMSWNVYAWTHPLVSTGGQRAHGVYSVLVTHKPVPGRCREHSTAQRPVLSAPVAARWLWHVYNSVLIVMLGYQQ